MIASFNALRICPMYILEQLLPFKYSRISISFVSNLTFGALTNAFTSSDFLSNRARISSLSRLSQSAQSGYESSKNSQCVWCKPDSRRPVIASLTISMCRFRQTPSDENDPNCVDTHLWLFLWADSDNLFRSESICIFDCDIAILLDADLRNNTLRAHI